MLRYRWARGCEPCRPVLGRVNRLRQPSSFPAYLPPSRRGSTVACQATKKSYYDVLGVPSGASEKEIKSAYRKAALKLHPDVNTAPDAKERFMEAKAAFETLTDANQRREYDRRLRMGFDTSSWGASSSSSSAGQRSSGYGYGQQQRRQSAPEDNYTFDDLLRDLDKEFSAWSASKAKSGAPKSLWEELEMIGEELVDFLEDTIGIKEDAKADQQQGKAGPSGASASTGSTGSNSSTAGRKATDYTQSDWYKRYEDLGFADEPSRPQGSGNGNARETTRPAQEAPKKPPEQEIDEMLAELKRKYKK